jgi:hypothetical protein
MRYYQPCMHECVCGQLSGGSAWCALTQGLESLTGLEGEIHRGTLIDEQGAAASVCWQDT